MKVNEESHGRRGDKQVQAEQEKTGTEDVAEGMDSGECLGLQLVCVERGEIAVVAEQAKHPDEVADRDQEDPGVGEPEPRRKQRGVPCSPDRTRDTAPTRPLHRGQPRRRG